MASIADALAPIPGKPPSIAGHVRSAHRTSQVRYYAAHGSTTCLDFIANVGWPLRFFAKARLSPALVRWLIVSLACPRKELELAQGRSINGVIPDLAPERGFAALQVQLERLQEFKGQDCRTVHSKETGWCHLTKKLIIRTFGNLSVNYKNFSEAKAVDSLFRGGKHQALDQKYFEDRINAYEAMLRSTIEELRLDLPTAGIAGVHKPGDQ